MTILRGLMQRSWFGFLLVSNPLFAEATHMYRKCTSATSEEFLAEQMTRLRALIDGFHQAGLCRELAIDKAGGLRRRADLAALPILNRQGLRALFPSLQQAHAGRSDVSTHTTGGSTGEPVRFMFSRRHKRLTGTIRLYMNGLLGWRLGMPRFALWVDTRDIGVTENSARSLPDRVKQYMQGQYVYGGYSPSEQEYLRFLRAVRAHRHCAVWGLNTLLQACAKLMLSEGQILPPGHVATAWNCGEMMYPQQRALIQQAFGVKPREYYSSRECSAIAVECAHGSLHVSPRYLIEVVDTETLMPLPDGQTGKLLLTDLFNDVTPLIRYEIGDLGAIEWRDCACGTRGLCITDLAGRVAWMIRLPSGTRIHSFAFNAMVNYLPALHQWKAVRLGPEEFEVHHTGDELNEADRQKFLRMLDVALEGSDVRIVRVEELEHTPTGKLRQYEDLSGIDER